MMIDYSSRAENVPEEILFKAYAQSVIDRLTLVYDPVYSSQTVHADSFYNSYNRTDMERTFREIGVWEYIPQKYRQGVDILNDAQNFLPVLGQRKNSGYLPFLACFTSMCLRGYSAVPYYEFPSGGTAVTPENTGSISPSRFPRFHGKDSYSGGNSSGSITEYVTWADQMKPWYGEWWERGFLIHPLDLNGNPAYTVSKRHMCACLDHAMNMCTAILHLWSGGADHRVARSVDGGWGDPYYYRRTQMYSTFRLREIRNGTVYREFDSENGDVDYGAELGWNTEDNIRKTVQLTARIYSSSPFRYKYLILIRAGDSGHSQTAPPYLPYSLVWNKLSVLYESSDWVSGAQTINLELSPGSDPGVSWSATMGGLAVMILPDYPDRLAEYLQN